jgi:hypothetical protein
MLSDAKNEDKVNTSMALIQERPLSIVRCVATSSSATIARFAV